MKAIIFFSLRVKEKRLQQAFAATVAANANSQ
jgi:hypothetical protein